MVPILAERGIELDVMQLAALFEPRASTTRWWTGSRALRDDGYKTAIVTNNVQEAAAGWRAMLDLDALFDVVVDSSAVGMRKPDPAIYRLALAELGGVPSRSGRCSSTTTRATSPAPGRSACKPSSSDPIRCPPWPSSTVLLAG